MDNLEAFEPLEYYSGKLRESFEAAAADYFDELVKKSGVDTAANAATVEKYRVADGKQKKASAKLSSGKRLRGIVIFLTVAAFIAATVLLLIYSDGGDITLLVCGILCALLGVACIVILCTCLKKMILMRQNKFDRAAAQAQQLMEEALAQLRPLHSLFTWDMTRELMLKVFPGLELDKRLSVEKLDLFMRKYGYRPAGNDAKSSTLFLLSGNLHGNPFLFERRLHCNILPHKYTGSLTIHWTTYTIDSNGNGRSVQHTQTLYASVEKPAPRYSEETCLFYGNEAAPDLTFSRRPQYSHNRDERSLEKIIKKGGKKLAAKTRRTAAAGGGFTELANTEFEVLFGATDRNNEVQFRLMFTPLAQKNMVNLMTSSEGYGDDFVFSKSGMLNCIRSDHAQSWQPLADPGRYMSFDLTASRRAFMQYNTEYFKSVYFDLAPLLSVPLYHMHKPHEFIYRDIYESNYAIPQSESLSNRMVDKFAPAKAKTRSVLKAEFVQKDGASDKVLITAYAFDTAERVDYVNVLGGDGVLHAVPVPWTEYLPIDRTSVMEVKAVDGTQEEYERLRSEQKLASFVRRFSINGDSVYGDGLIGIPLDKTYDKSDDKELDGIFGVKRAAAYMAGIAAVERAADMLDRAEAQSEADKAEDAAKDQVAATDEAGEEDPDGSDT